MVVLLCNWSNKVVLLCNWSYKEVLLSDWSVVVRMYGTAMLPDWLLGKQPSIDIGSLTGGGLGPPNPKQNNVIVALIL